jgi:hypothetical protein
MRYCDYLIINTTEVDKIDFSQVKEDSVNSLRYSLDGSKTFFKWNYEEPTFLQSFDWSDGPISNI